MSNDVATAIVLALAGAAIVLVLVELTRSRADPIVWAVGLVAIAEIVGRLSNI